MVCRYIVKLSAEERVRLERLVGTGKRAAAALTHARILLKADSSTQDDKWDEDRIAEALDTSRSTVYRVRKEFVEEGLEAALYRKRPTGRQYRKLDGAGEAHLIALACSKAPESGMITTSTKHMSLVMCPDCKAMVPDSKGPVHPYLGASAGCWKLFGEVLATEYTDFQYGKVHRLTVDAYAVQHPGKSERRAIQSVNIHLVALCLVLESKMPYPNATRVLSELTKRQKERQENFDWLEPPDNPGKITIIDIHAAPDAETHCRMVQEWALSVYHAWGQHHDRIRALARSFL